MRDFVTSMYKTVINLQLLAYRDTARGGNFCKLFFSFIVGYFSLVCELPFNLFTFDISVLHYITSIIGYCDRKRCANKTD